MIRKASKRISFLVKDFLRYEPTLCIERAVLYDEGYENSAHQSIICKRADAIANVLDHMTLYILPGELIAGNQASAPRSAPVFPEFATKWLLSELDVLHLRKSSSFKIANDKKEILRKVLTKWNGRNVNDHIMNNLSDEIKDAEKTLAIIHSGLSSGTGHMIIDYEMVIEHGVKNLLTLLQQKKEKKFRRRRRIFWIPASLCLKRQFVLQNATVLLQRSCPKRRRRQNGHRNFPGWRKSWIKYRRTRRMICMKRSKVFYCPYNSEY